jgi:methyl-accepting chemotaxis protein
MAEREKMINKIFRRTDIKISVLISCCMVVIILLSVYILSGISSRAISDAMYGKGKMASSLGAKSISIALETAVDNKILTLEEIFDSQYVPIAGSDPQLFNTKFDAYMDAACSQFQGTFFNDSDVAYARSMDQNGYVPLQGGVVTDNKKTRNTKDPSGKQILDGKRISMISANTVDGFMQDYVQENTGSQITEFSAPIYVKGERWGSFSVGFRNLSKAGGASAITMILAVSSILICCAVVIGVVFFFLKPISGLAEAAEQVADGDVDQSVEIGGSNDIATLADAIERLRVSLKLSMDRMVKK